jgi:protein TonB
LRTEITTMKHLRALPVLALWISSFLYVAQAFAQGESIETIQEAPPAEESDSELFTFVEQMPQFPGGPEAMLKFISGNINYPEEASEAGIQGAVYVGFVVEKDGVIDEVRVLRGIGGGCDEEAVRVVSAMPNWEPGVQRGKPVRVRFNLPIRYRLTDPVEKK